MKQIIQTIIMAHFVFSVNAYAQNISSDFKLDKKAPNSEGCFSELTLSYDETDKVLQFSKAFGDGSSIIYSDYYFTQINDPKFASYYYGATGASYSSWEENQFTKSSNNIFAFKSLVQHRGFGSNGLIREFQLLLNGEEMYFSDVITISNPDSQIECYYRKSY